MKNEVKIKESQTMTNNVAMAMHGLSLAEPVALGQFSQKLAKWNEIVSARKDITDQCQIVALKSELQRNNIVLYRVDEITYEEDAPQLEALENALSCMAVPGMNLVYLIHGQGGMVQFYFGLVKDTSAINEETDKALKVGEAFLRPALEGNFRGSVIRKLTPDELEGVRGCISGLLKERRYCRVLSGVPGGVKDKEKQDFRGIDRLVDVMQGDNFAFMIIAKPILSNRIGELRRNVFGAYEMLSIAAKQSVQLGVNEGQNQGKTVNESKSVADGTSSTTSKNDSWSDAKNSGTSEKRSEHSRFTDSNGHTLTKSGGASKSEGKNRTLTASAGKSDSVGSSQGASVTLNSDLTNKAAAVWVKYFDDVLIPRLDYARGKGAYVVNMTILGENPQVARKLTQAARSIFAGEMANMVPLISREPTDVECKHIENFSMPFGVLSDADVERLPYAQSGLLEYASTAKVDGQPMPVLYSGNWMSVRELALMAGLPQKEVVGLRLKEEVEFGLNVPETKLAEETKEVELGALVKSGNLCRGCTVNLDSDQLDRHVFVAGVTGSGKTTTCQTLLKSSGWPFLVIEPAKTEYRGLRFPSKDKDGKDQKALCPDLLVFTLGDDTVAPFRLNPFELIPGESVTARVDMLMASITAAFDMEAAIPQLIERAIYSCYEDYGWNLDTNMNSLYPYAKDGSGKTNYESGPFEEGKFAFPTLSDVLKKINLVVREQGFDERLKNDYIGSIKARLQGLTLGAKGFMLDCPRSVNFLSLLDKQVVLELESIPNAAQKSLIIGFVLTNLLQAVKYKYAKGKGKKVRHITLIEEAHRLLSKPEPGGNPSQKQAAETFADMLAEIRKYGESLVIADQIPGKLTPEVMKNTNTKIIHRLFASDDKEAVGHTMGLEEDQAEFLSNLAVGRAVVFNGNWPKAVQVQITQAYRTDSQLSGAEDEDIRKATLQFYASEYKHGALVMPTLFKGTPNTGALLEALESQRDLTALFRHTGDYSAREWSPVLLMRVCDQVGVDTVRKVLSNTSAALEFIRLVDRRAKKSPELDSLIDLINQFGAEVVWAVLSAREYDAKEQRRIKELYLGFWSDFMSGEKIPSKDPKLPEKLKWEISLGAVCDMRATMGFQNAIDF